MICPSEEKKTRSYPTSKTTTQQKKKNSGRAISEVAGKDAECFDAEVHPKAGEEKNNRVLSFQKNASGTTHSMPQKGVNSYGF